MRKRLINLRIPADGPVTSGADTVERDLLIRDGRIAEIVPPAGRPAEADEERVDLENALVLPGAIDGHVHFDDPGFTHRENFETGTRAAAAGGVTCIVDMPCTSLPPVTTRANLEAKLSVIAPRAHVDFMLWGGASANSLADPDWARHLEELVEDGVAAIKVYMLSGMDTFRDLTVSQIESVLRETHRLGIPAGVHAEDRAQVIELTERLRAEGANGPLDYAASRPAAAEVCAVTALRDLCRRTGARVHVVHLASGEALDVVTAARAEGLLLSAETCPHFLAFTEADLEAQGALLKTAPVVKSEADRARLWEGVAGGQLQYVATDHAAGQWPEEKHTGSIWTDYGGVPGVEILLPYMYSDGYRAGRLSLARLVEVTASEPARFFGIESRKGRMAEGLDADLAVIDEEDDWTVRASDLHSLNRYTPHEGQRLAGRVRATLVRGEEVFRRHPGGAETFGSPGHGHRVRRETRVET
jgi:allantoinase